MLTEMPRQSRFYQRFGFPIIRFIAWVIYMIFGPMRIRGKYRIPKKGGVLILANHISDSDPPAVQIACPRPCHFMGKSELFDIKIIGPFISKIGVFPVKRNTADRNALRYSVKLLQEGEALGIFPEGEVSPTGEQLPLKPGLAWIAKSANVPIICCGIIGTDRIIPHGSVIPRPAFHFIELNFGEPRHFDPTTPDEEIVAWVEGQFRELTGKE